MRAVRMTPRSAGVRLVAGGSDGRSPPDGADVVLDFVGPTPP